VPRTAVLAVGQLFLHEPRDEAAELKPDHRDALQELLRQVAGQVATVLNAWRSCGREWKLRPAGSRNCSPAAALTSSLSLKDDLPCDFTCDFTPEPCLLAPCDIVMRLEDTRWECFADSWPSW
jgi:hypothetical protein